MAIRTLCGTFAMVTGYDKSIERKKIISGRSQATRGALYSLEHELC